MPANRSSLARWSARRVLVPLALAALGASVFAVESSVDVNARWRVLPYQSLSIRGFDGRASRVTVSLSSLEGEAAVGGVAEHPRAIRLHVASNIPWKVQLRIEGIEPESGSRVEARRSAGPYVQLSNVPVVLASGPHGAYDIDVGLLLVVEGETGGADLRDARLIATILPD